MTAFVLAQSKILVFCAEVYDFDRLFVDTSMHVHELGDDQFLHASTPARGFGLLEREPNIRIVVVIQCPDAERPDYCKLHLIRDIKLRITDKRHIITVGPFEPKSFLKAGATHEANRELLPRLLGALLQGKKLKRED